MQSVCREVRYYYQMDEGNVQEEQWKGGWSSLSTNDKQQLEHRESQIRGFFLMSPPIPFFQNESHCGP